MKERVAKVVFLIFINLTKFSKPIFVDLRKNNWNAILNFGPFGADNIGKFGERESKIQIIRSVPQ
jgi:hypothetical protein